MAAAATVCRPAVALLLLALLACKAAHALGLPLPTKGRNQRNACTLNRYLPQCDEQVAGGGGSACA